MNKYIGHTMQLYGIEEVRLCGGKADGMRLLNVKNAKGLEFSISLDRCADITKVSLEGVNYSFIAPCGYVSPKYYDNKGAGFLKSFTAGFMTTCGLTQVGSPCIDDGEELPLHGTISNTPCENVNYYTDDENMYIKAYIRDSFLFSYHLILEREYVVPIYENIIYLKDTIKNIGRKDAPLEVMYHCNIGYPILTENSIVKIPATKTEARNEHSQKHIDKCLTMEIPQKDFDEMCYYHTLEGQATVSIYSPDAKKGLEMNFDTKELKCFTQWKMMGEYEYVLGLEPGNCTPDGRDVMRKKGMLEILKAGDKKVHNIKFTFTKE